MALSLVRHLPGARSRRAPGASGITRAAGRSCAATRSRSGILGLGRIGTRMAHISHPCFGRVLACDPYVEDAAFPEYVRRVALDQLFAESNILSLHVPLNDETREIVNSRTLALMKPGSILVNTARGGVVDLDAVIRALDAGTLKAAGLDVLPREPMPPEHPILKDSRVILTPHSAFYSVEGAVELRRKAAQNLVDWALTGRPTYVVVEGR
jgi:D-3-phosphoglycerate dehydrogenase